MNEPKVTIEEVTDPVEIARHRACHEKARRNAEWLEMHWADILPQAHGKFVAVAGQETFIADTGEEAAAPALTIRMTRGFCLNTSFHPEVRESMVIAGKWVRCDDGITRPAVPPPRF